MSRNEEMRFNHLPDIEISRSRLNLSHSVKLTADVGEVVPFFWTEILPGDTIDITTNIVCRLQPLVAPIMDSLYIDSYYFYVPSRLVWSHFKEFMGEDPVNPWDNPIEYTIPQLSFPTNGVQKGTIADYFGLPINVPTDQTVSALPFRSYALICNDWFRDTNIMNGVHIWTDDTTRTMSNGSDQVTDIELGGKPFIACKSHDYFTSALRDAQRGNPALVNTGTIAPVITNDMSSIGGNLSNWFTEIGNTGESVWSNLHGPSPIGTSVQLDYNAGSGPWKYAQDWTGSGATSIGLEKTSSNMALLTGAQSVVSGNDKYPFFGNLSSYIYNFSGFTTNELRQAFAVQKFMEKSARGGNRYRDMLYSQFGVTASDASLQRSEYLGGSRIPVQVSQVTQTSSSSGSGSSGQFLGDVAGQSVTMDSSDDVFRSFDEHGFVIGVMVMRYDHTYSQGIPRMFSRKSKFDMFFPVFSNLGEQIVRRKELYLNNTTEETSASLDMKNDSAFGYQEAWAEYRYMPNRVCGEMRPTYSQPLDMWHLGDKYAKAPTLSSDWIREDKSNLDRCLAVTSNVANQYFADIYIQNTMSRPMPLYSIPGLIDHH